MSADTSQGSELEVREMRQKLAQLQLDLDLEAHREAGSVLKSAFNWLYPTIVTLNSGALFLLLANYEKLDADTVFRSGSAFSLGIFLAILLAHRTIKRSAEGRELIGERIETLSLRALGLDADLNLEALQLKANAINRGQKLSSLIGWAGVFCFFAGLGIFWTGIS